MAGNWQMNPGFRLRNRQFRETSDAGGENKGSRPRKRTKMASPSRESEFYLTKPALPYRSSLVLRRDSTACGHGRSSAGADPRSRTPKQSPYHRYSAPKRLQSKTLRPASPSTTKVRLRIVHKTVRSKEILCSHRLVRRQKAKNGNETSLFSAKCTTRPCEDSTLHLLFQGDSEIKVCPSSTLGFLRNVRDIVLYSIRWTLDRRLQRRQAAALSPTRLDRSPNLVSASHFDQPISAVWSHSMCSSPKSQAIPPLSPPVLHPPALLVVSIRQKSTDMMRPTSMQKDFPSVVAKLIWTRLTHAKRRSL